MATGNYDTQFKKDGLDDNKKDELIGFSI